MCLSVPGRVIKLNGTSGKVDVAGNAVDADFSLLPDAEIGEYVLVHAGFAIQRYSEEEAIETLKALKELYEAEQQHG